MDGMSLLTITVLAVFVGFEVVSKVSSTLHTPLMSGANAIHGIILVGAIIVAVGAAMALPAWLERMTSEFGVTSKRVIIKVGLIQRRTLELLIRQVEAISVDQSLTGRLLNFGTITLTGTGGVRETFHNIADPLEFRRSIQGLSTM